MKPIIGIVCCGITQKQQFVTNAYINAVRLSGGYPVLLPLLPPEFEPEYFLETCNGFLFPGGIDFSPLLFDEDPVPGIEETNLDVDIFQIHLAELALAKQKPILGICRGMQVLSAACGGSIYQDLSLHTLSHIQHMQTSQNRSDVWHKVSVAEGSFLRAITGDTIYTNSFHHQSIHVPGTNVIPCAFTSDGIIEAIEIQGQPFALGIQWHPEAMFFSSSCMRELFSAFIRAAASPVTD